MRDQTFCLCGFPRPIDSFKGNELPFSYFLGGCHISWLDLVRMPSIVVSTWQHPL